MRGQYSSGDPRAVALAAIATETDRRFRVAHPEREGRRLSASEPDYATLAEEWMSLRYGVAQQYAQRHGGARGAAASSISGTRSLVGFNPAAAVKAVMANDEISDAERHAATDAANAAIAPLVENRAALMRGWKPDKVLTREQYASIMKVATDAARACEQSLTAMLDKVPAHWEGFIRQDLPPLHQALAEAPGFEALIANTKTSVVPGFRAWIDHLLSRVEDGTATIAYISNVIPDWLSMRDLMSSLHRAAVAIIAGLVALAKDTANFIGDLDWQHAALYGGLALAGLAALSALSGVASNMRSR